jgi:hypothetical protein
MFSRPLSNSLEQVSKLEPPGPSEVRWATSYSSFDVRDAGLAGSAHFFELHRHPELSKTKSPLCLRHPYPPGGRRVPLAWDGALPFCVRRGRDRKAGILRRTDSLDMKTAIERYLRSGLLIYLASLPAYAEEGNFDPELDANFKVNQLIRLNFQAKDERDAGSPAQASIGPGVQFYLKPLVRLKRVTLFDLDDAKSRFLVLEAGYRYVATPDEPATNRMLVSATFNYPLAPGLLIQDRNRADLDWKNGEFTWRYRNRFWVQQAISIHSFHLIPYVAVEPYYVEQYHKWSTTAFYAGSLIPVGKHVQFNTYYENENNTGKAPNKPVRTFGLALGLYFSRKQAL